MLTLFTVFARVKVVNFIFNFFSFQPAFVQKVTKSSSEKASQNEDVSSNRSSHDGINDPDTSIAMMRDSQLAWEQLRKIRRFVMFLICKLQANCTTCISDTVHDK